MIGKQRFQPRAHSLPINAQRVALIIAATRGDCGGHDINPLDHQMHHQKANVCVYMFR